MDLQKAHKLLTTFFSDGKELRLKAKEPIIQVGANIDTIYLIESGVVKVISINNSGSEQIHHLYKSGEIFSAAVLCNDSSFRNSPTTGFTAFANTVLKAKPLKETRMFLEKNPYAIINILKQQSVIYDEIINLNIVSAEQRVADRLKHMARRFGTKQDGVITIKLPMTVQQFSEIVRLSRESTGRILRQLEEKGAIIMSRQRILVYPDKLVTAYESGSSTPSNP